MELLEQIQKNLDAITVQMKDELRKVGEVSEKTAKEFDAMSAQLAEIRKEQREMREQVDAIDAKIQKTAPGAAFESALAREMKDNVSLQTLMRDRRGAAVLRIAPSDLLLRTTVTSSSISVQPERVPGIIPEPRSVLRIRNLLSSVPVQSNAVEFVRVLNHAKVVSPQTETQPKAENEITFELQSVPVRTIATWIPATKQILDDFEGLEGFLRSSLTYALEEEFEDQLLLGSGSGQNLNGLYTQATAFNTALLGTSWNRIDVLARAIQQLASANQIQPDFVALNPADYWSIRLAKDENGRYLLPEPANNGPAQIWGLTVVPTNAMAAGTFLVGTSSPAAAVIRMRQDATVEISTEHSDYFTRNMVAIRAELRAALVVMRPGAFIKGNLTASPA